MLPDHVRRVALIPAATLLFLAVGLLARPAAQSKNPFKGLKDALKNAEEQAKHPEQKQGTSTTAPPAAGQPWTPPADDSASTKPVTLDPAKMPDVVGVRLGMTPEQALEAIRKQYPGDKYQRIVNTDWPSTTKPEQGYEVLSSPDLQVDAYTSFTAPPGQQMLWRIARNTRRMHINHATLMATLRQKYGKETAAYAPSSNIPLTDDTKVSRMVWLFDENGGRIASPPNGTVAKDLAGCDQEAPGPQPMMPVAGRTTFAGGATSWCQEHYVGILISFDTSDIVEQSHTIMLDFPLVVRTAKAASVWLHDLANRQHQEDLESSKNAKPAF